MRFKNIDKIKKDFSNYVNHIDSDNNNILMYLIENNNSKKYMNNINDVIEENKNNHNFFQQINNKNENVFLIACRYNYEDIAIKILKISNNNLNLINTYGNTSLMYILKFGMNNLYKIFMDNNYINQFDLGYINNKDKYSSYLYYSIMNKNTIMLKKILMSLNNSDLYKNIKIIKDYYECIHSNSIEEKKSYLNILQKLNILYERNRMNQIIHIYDNKINLPNSLYQILYEYTFAIA